MDSSSDSGTEPGWPNTDVSHLSDKSDDRNNKRVQLMTDDDASPDFRQDQPQLFVGRSKVQWTK